MCDCYEEACGEVCGTTHMWKCTSTIKKNSKMWNDWYGTHFWLTHATRMLTGTHAEKHADI